MSDGDSDEDGLGVHGVQGVDGAGEGVEVDSLHRQVDARHKARQLARRRLLALSQHADLLVVCNTQHSPFKMVLNLCNLLVRP